MSSSLRGLKIFSEAPLLGLVNPIIPTPPRDTRIQSKPPNVLYGSFGPTAVTAPPAIRAALLPRLAAVHAPRNDIRRWLAVAALIMVGAVAARFTPHVAPAKPSIVSGRAGLKHTKSGQVERWWRDRVTVTLDGSLSALSPAAHDAVEDAFGAWLSSDAKIPRLAFDSRETKPLVMAPDGENRIYYAPIRIPGQENDLGITLVYTNPDTGEIVEADMIINSLHQFALLDGLAGSTNSTGTKATKSDDGDDSSASDGSGEKKPSSHASATAKPAPPTSCSGTYDFRSVATHEAGHFFGLGEDMTDTSATMYYSTQPCDVHKRELKGDDASQVASLYVAPPEGAPEEDPAASASRCSVGSLGGSTPHAPSAAFAALAMTVTALRRRRR